VDRLCRVRLPFADNTCGCYPAGYPGAIRQVRLYLQLLLARPKRFDLPDPQIRSLVLNRRDYGAALEKIWRSDCKKVLLSHLNH
jgi:hypothetical protein